MNYEESTQWIKKILDAITDRVKAETKFWVGIGFVE